MRFFSLVHHVAITATLATPVFAPVNASTQAVGVDGQQVASRNAEATVLARRVTVSLTQVSLEVALRAIARSSDVRAQYEISVVTAVKTPVSVSVKNVPLGEVLAHVLVQTGLEVTPLGSDAILIARRETDSVSTGTVMGHIVEAQTARPLVGVTVTLDDASRGVLTDASGRFSVSGVSAGTHRVHARLIGYARQAKEVSVSEGTTTTADFVLTAHTNTLDQVVVTGTVIPTELKAVPTAITVITAKQLEERGITHIDQLFRGDVPGVFAASMGTQSDAKLGEVTMFSRGASGITFMSQGILRSTNPIKTYVDGVEMVDPKYLSHIDPKSIERIEILTGPQASTIYGSNAINGVMQVFTKRGTSSTPQLTLDLQSGWVENNFSSARTPQHVDNVQVDGVEGRISYNTGVSWNYMGPWSPASQASTLSEYGGVHTELPFSFGRTTADVSLRHTMTLNRQRGNNEQVYANFAQGGVFSQDTRDYFNYVGPQNQQATGQTFGVALSYAPFTWWSHNIRFGRDESISQSRTTAFGYVYYADTNLQWSQYRLDGRSIQYSTTASIPIAKPANLTVTVGGEGLQTSGESFTIQGTRLKGGFSNASFSNSSSHNSGAFVQSQLGLFDQLFLTYGGRAEWNPGFGQKAQPNYSPRYGAAYTISTGAVTTKLRVSYGRSTRPVAPSYQAGNAVTNANVIQQYGPFYFTLPNPDLSSEFQKGGEGGLEVYVGNRGSLVVTRYNQTIDGLVESPTVDSVRSLHQHPPFYSVLEPDGYGYFYQRQYVNAASIRNQGWELQGNLPVGPLTLHGTYSWTKSRTIGVTEKYRQYFVNDSRYVRGASFNFVTEHTWATDVTYSSGKNRMSVHVSGIGSMIGVGGNEIKVLHMTSYARLLDTRWRMIDDNYNPTAPGYAMVDLNASRVLSSSVDAVLQIANLSNYYHVDYAPTAASMGRQVRFGLRARWR